MSRVVRPLAKMGLLYFTLLIPLLDSAQGEAINKEDLDMYFMPITNLEPLIVKSEEFSISVFARTNSEKNYVERFAHSVVEVAYETIEKSTGNGLVIAGGKTAPHPISVFNRFLELQEQGVLSPDMANSAAELKVTLDKWKTLSNDDSEEKSEDDVDIKIDFETLATLIPMPLEGAATQLYLVAWFEEFDSVRIDDKLKSLSLEDLQQYELSKYDWIFYLPPKNSIKQVIHKLLPQIMKEAELGFFKRVAIRGAIATFKPLIKDAAEAIRKGVLYYAVLDAMGTIEEDDLSALCEAYITAIMPHGKIFPGDKKQRAIEAISRQKIVNAEYAKDPFISPERLNEYEVSTYLKFQGDYGYDGNPACSFFIEKEKFYWQKKENDPQQVFPAGDYLLVSDDGKSTIEFSTDDEGNVISVEERWKRKRNTTPKTPSEFTSNSSSSDVEDTARRSDIAFDH